MGERKAGRDPRARASRRGVSGCGVATGVAVLLIVACQSAPPPPPPEPAPEPAPVVEASPTTARAPAPEVWAKVTGSSLNVRERPDQKSPKVAALKRGARVLVVGEQGEWLEVRSGGTVTGWVASKYLAKELACLPDKATAEILNPPALTMAAAGPHGNVVIEATVNAEGRVTAATTLSNSTGDAELERRARAELEQLRFSPPVRRCRPVAFIYTYTRAF